MASGESERVACSNPLRPISTAFSHIARFFSRLVTASRAREE